MGEPEEKGTRCVLILGFVRTVHAHIKKDNDDFSIRIIITRQNNLLTFSRLIVFKMF